MMWLLFAVLLVFARHADCGALRCSEGSSCTAEEESNERNLPSGVDCAPGTSWKNQCNHCWCEQGYAMCTLMGCFNYAEPETHCAPNSSWRKGCNICHCTEGMPVCTERKCNQDTGSTVAVDETNSEHAQRSQPKALAKVEKRDTRCEPNAEFKSECNVCKCSSNGRSFSCTQNECLEGDVNGDVEVFQETDGADHIERHSVCEPYTVFYIACNACQCNSQGTDFACSLKICPLPKDVEVFHEFRGTQSALSRKKRAFQEVPKQCQPGQEFRMDCNKCLCDNEGQNFSCTRMDCNALNNHNGDAFSSRTKRETEKQQMKCVPGSVFDRECNVCRCSDEGQHAVCTMNRCASHDGSTEGPAPDQDEGFRCNPGEQFAQKCNDCTCSADGRSVFCTLRLCDKDISADI